MPLRLSSHERIDFKSSIVVANGFSTKTAKSVASASFKTAACVSFGVAIITASIKPESSSAR